MIDLKVEVYLTNSNVTSCDLESSSSSTFEPLTLPVESSFDTHRQRPLLPTVSESLFQLPPSQSSHPPFAIEFLDDDISTALQPLGSSHKFKRKRESRTASNTPLERQNTAGPTDSGWTPPATNDEFSRISNWFPISRMRSRLPKSRKPEGSATNDLPTQETQTQEPDFILSLLPSSEASATSYASRDGLCRNPDRRAEYTQERLRSLLVPYQVETSEVQPWARQGSFDSHSVPSPSAHHWKHSSTSHVQTSDSEARRHPQLATSESNLEKELEETQVADFSRHGQLKRSREREPSPHPQSKRQNIAGPSNPHRQLDTPSGDPRAISELSLKVQGKRRALSPASPRAPTGNNFHEAGALPAGQNLAAGLSKVAKKRRTSKPHASTVPSADSESTLDNEDCTSSMRPSENLNEQQMGETKFSETALPRRSARRVPKLHNVGRSGIQPVARDRGSKSQIDIIVTYASAAAHSNSTKTNFTMAASRSKIKESDSEDGHESVSMVGYPLRSTTTPSLRRPRPPPKPIPGWTIVQITFSELQKRGKTRPKPESICQNPRATCSDCRKGFAKSSDIVRHWDSCMNGDPSRLVCRAECDACGHWVMNRADSRKRHREQCKSR
ncbi:hypothetical protein C8J57DRAFT_366867 [Mycena rebaudengoi]|nr:hypothetical protein C8J57DRAFT_366867 [Mycena rebaudengoi]